MPRGVYVRTKEYRKKQSESHKCKTSGMKGKTPWNKGLTKETNKIVAKYAKSVTKTLTGRKLSDEHRKNIGKSRKGEKSNLWRGGKSFEEYGVDWTKTLKRSIRERDRYTCQVCGDPQNDITHCIHHIYEDKKNNNPNNLITVCRSCHMKIHKNKNNPIQSLRGALL